MVGWPCPPQGRPARLYLVARCSATSNNGSSPPLITISVNGKPVSLESGATLSRLLDTLGLAGRKVAVERNGEIVPRSRHAESVLADGDRLEVVVAVGGG